MLCVQYGFVGPNWAPRPVAALENDEICAELRQYTEQLRALMGRNKATVERLLKAAASATTRNEDATELSGPCLLYTSPSPRDKRQSRMPSSA